MEIATLKDLRHALNKMPDDVLDKFGVGLNSEGGDYVELLAFGDGQKDWEEIWSDTQGKYPVISDISNWFKAINKMNKHIAISPDDEKAYNRDSPISSKEVSADSSQS